MSEQPQQRQPTAAEAAILAAVEQQRQQQVALGAQAAAAFLAVWGGFVPAYAAGDLARWFREVLGIARPYANAGWELSRRGYFDLRALSGAGGLQPALRPIPLDEYRFWLQMRDAVIRPYADDLLKGTDPARAADAAAARGAGVTQKHTSEPGRKLVHEAVDKAAAERGAPLPPFVQPPRPGEVDRQLIGWVRTTDGDPCYWCGMLASRGAVYASLESAEFRKDGEKYHPNCGCKAYPIFTDAPVLPEINYEMEMLWREAQRNPPPGERIDQQKPRPGSDRKADVAGRAARNNFRRLLAQRSREMARQQGAPDSGP